MNTRTNAVLATSTAVFCLSQQAAAHGIHGKTLSLGHHLMHVLIALGDQVPAPLWLAGVTLTAAVATFMLVRRRRSAPHRSTGDRRIGPS